MQQIQLINAEELQQEIKELKETLAYWTNELDFKREADMAKAEAKEAKQEFHEMWKSRSLYIEVITTIITILKKLPNEREAFPILKNFIKDNKVDKEEIFKTIKGN